MSTQMAGTIIPLVLLILVMYFLIIRPQKRREKEVNIMRKSLHVGDEIITIGGICGKIVRTKDETIIVQVGSDKIKIEMMRWAVSSVVKEAPGKARDYYDEVKEEEEPKKKGIKRLRKEVPEEAEEAVVETAETVETAAEEVKDIEEEILDDK